MNKKLPSLVAGAAFAIYILTIIVFAASLFIETRRNNVEERFRNLIRETNQNLSTNDIDSDAFVSAFLRSLGNLSDISSVQIKHEGDIIFAYPSDSLNGKSRSSSLIYSGSGTLTTKDDISLTLSADIYRLKPSSIFYKGRIAFIIILIITLICLLTIIYLTLYGREGEKHQNGRKSPSEDAEDGNFVVHEDESVRFDLLPDDEDEIEDSLVIQDDDEDIDDETSIDLEMMAQLENEERESDVGNAETVVDEVANMVAQIPVEEAVSAPAPQNAETLSSVPPERAISVAEETQPQGAIPEASDETTETAGSGTEDEARIAEAPTATDAGEPEQEELLPLDDAGDIFNGEESPSPKEQPPAPAAELETPASAAEPATSSAHEQLIAAEEQAADFTDTEEPTAPVEQPPLAPPEQPGVEEEPAPVPEAAEPEPVQRQAIAVADLPADNSPKGLYSERTGFGWESYMIPRLDNELVRAASSEQDLALFTITVRDINWLSDEGTEVAKLIATTVNFSDLIFEYKDDGCMAIFPNTNVDSAIAIAEDLHQRILTTLQGYSDPRPVRIGISARSLRMISGDRLAHESAQALEHTDEASPIVAFKVNPQKYRSFLAEQAKLLQEGI